MQSEVTLVKHRRWYIPADAESYEILRGLGMASTQIHEDLIGALKMVCKKKKVVLKGRPFKIVQEEFLDNLIPKWERPGRRIIIKRNRVILSASGKGYEKGRKFGIPKSKEAIQKFCDRWGLSVEITISENEGRSIKLVADFVKGSRAPVIDVQPLGEDKPTVLDFGRHRIRIVREGRFLLTHLELKSADDWQIIRTCRSLPQEMADPTAFMTAVLDVANVT